MIDERMKEEFYKELGNTGKLVEYFREGYDFGIDLYDPVIEDIMELIYEGSGDDPAKLFYSEGFLSALTRGMTRHITLKDRYEIFSALGSVYGKAGSRDKNRIRTARLALEDNTIHPGFIGVVFELYHRDVIEKVHKRIHMEADREDTGELPELVEKVMTEPSAEIISRIGTYREKAIGEIGYAIFRGDIEYEHICNLLEAAVSIKCHRTAKLLLDVLMEFGTPGGGGDSRIKTYLVEMLPLLSIHIFNMLDNREADFFDRWIIYEFLMSIPDQRVFSYLRRELDDMEFWYHKPLAGDDEEITTEFYGDITDWLIALADRRAVPVFIRLLHGGEDRGIPQDVLNTAAEKLRDSPWYEEIKTGLRLLDEGETVMIEQDQNHMEFFGRKTGEYAEFHKMMRGRAELADLQRKLDIETKRWNESYHESLDGLRPVDIPRAPLQIDLLKRMFSDFERKMAGREHEDMQEAMGEFIEFQDEWMLTPLEDRGGGIPLVMMMKEEESSADTFALKENFNAYKKSKVDALYVEASGLFDEGKKEAAAGRIKALLQLEPDHPFALGLAEKMRLDI
ncbi:MAG: hypothetical protein GXP46_07690 [Deferribacteres bacterium]|nr:hypothetical protein [Deferribacteres bacterium]